MTVEAESIPLPYVKTAADPADQGMKEEWFKYPERAGAWHPLWLSPMNYALRKWNVIGPFSNRARRRPWSEFSLPKEESITALPRPATTISYSAGRGLTLRLIRCIPWAGNGIWVQWRFRAAGTLTTALW